MSTIYGESSITSYASNGGIAVMSADIPPGAITGGSGDREDGSAGSVTRIRWWVYYDESNYSGGITGVGWFRKSHNDPFTDGMPATGPFEGIEESDIWETANGPAGNLDSYFNAWNASASSSQILEFQLYLVDYASDCITVGGMGG